MLCLSRKKLDRKKWRMMSRIGEGYLRNIGTGAVGIWWKNLIPWGWPKLSNWPRCLGFGPVPSVTRCSHPPARDFCETGTE